MLGTCAGGDDSSDSGGAVSPFFSRLCEASEAASSKRGGDLRSVSVRERHLSERIDDSAIRWTSDHCSAMPARCRILVRLLAGTRSGIRGSELPDDFDRSGDAELRSGCGAC